MRILLINRNFGTLFGGGEAFDLAVAESFAAAGHEVEILGGAPMFGKPAIACRLNVNYLHFPNLRSVAYSRAFWARPVARICYHVDLQLFQKWALRWILSSGRGSKFDVIQCCSLFDLSEDLLHRTNAGVVCWLPGEPSPRTQRTIRRLLKCDRFGLFSHGAGAAFLSARMGLEEFTEFQSIPPGVYIPPRLTGRAASAPFRARHSIPEDAILGATVARLIPIKNLSLLIRALRRVNEQIPLHWMIAGTGSLEDNLKRETFEAGLQNRVHFLGQQTREQVREVLAASDLFALSSDFESHPLALVEAMAYGLPVVVRPVGGCPALIEQSGAGLVATATDEQSFAESLLCLITQPELRNRHGRRAYQFALTQTWERTANLLLNLYRKTSHQSEEVLHPAGRA
jgi:glycosyltransferase involved in cell wall biosynthesis